jgi:4-amino-4-deoxy-L-arabinose transferase-like glycosyltransferase
MDRTVRPRAESKVARVAFALLAATALLFLTAYNLTEYPVTWFDEGAHLHVPKTLVRFGVYADYHSDGFRYYGPTVGIGPTVILPIAAVFRLFGIGLLQARLVMLAYLLGTVAVYYRLARLLGGHRLAWVATALLVTSRGVFLLELGRQVMGEVPSLFFLVSGLTLWFGTWEKPAWWHLVGVGLLLGLSTVTKSQILLMLAPALGLGWIANLIYYRARPQRLFVVPGIVMAACFGLWQLCLIVYLGPDTATENLRTMSEASAGAAFSFNPDWVRENIKHLTSVDVYLGTLPVILGYGFVLALPRDRHGQRWGMLFLLAAVGLAWFAFASIGWPRYAAPSLAITGLLAARVFADLTHDFDFGIRSAWQTLKNGRLDVKRYGPRWAMLIWLLIMVLRPLAYTTAIVLAPPFNSPAAMADYLSWVDLYPQRVLNEDYRPVIHIGPEEYGYDLFKRRE